MNDNDQAIESQEMHPDLYDAQKLAYTQVGLIVQDLNKEAESEEYGAFDFKMNGQFIKFRVGKITPKKIGQFVTIWKRIGKGPILPYDIVDPVDLFVISVCHEKHLGQFVFPKAVLCEKGILSKQGQRGKLAMRVYPPWDVTESLQAKKTQKWQVQYFFEIKPNLIDEKRVSELFS